jgi:Tol biopolymer transport system component
MRRAYRGRVRGLPVFVAALVLVPSALGDWVVYATDTVATPTHLIQMGIDGRGGHVVASMPVLDDRDGHVAGAHGDTLLVDGDAIATVRWPVDDARLSPDAGQVAFTAISTVNCDPSGTNCATWELWLVDRDGSNLRELTADGRFPQFSPDGKRLAFLGGYSPFDEGGTAVVETLASGKRTWFTSASDGRPAWTPDSKRIVYSAHGRLMVAMVAPRRVANLGVRGDAPQLSADGKTLAFSVLGGIAARALAHGTTRLVARGATGNWSWTPTGWIVYSAITRRYPQIFSLERVRGDGTGRAVIRTYAPTTTFDAIWPSGRTLFVQTTHTRFDVAAIESVDLATGAVRTLTNDLADDRSPTFSPAGALAYARGSSSRFGWYCLAVRQTCVVNAQTVDGVRHPDWSPDGTRIAFLQYTRHGTNVAVVDPDGSHLRVLHNFTGSAESPTWSPDGTQIVVGASNYPSTGDGHIHLWVLDVESGAATQLNTGDWGGTPSWSPDGRTIAFVGGTWGGPNTLELYDLSTGRYAPLVQLGSQPVDTRPGWSPDSQQLAYQAEDLTLHVIGQDGSGDRRITGPTATSSTLAWLAG